MCQSWIIKQVYKHFFVSYEAAGDVGVWKALDGHGPVVKAQQLVDVELVGLNLLLSPAFLTKIPEFELTIVEITDSKVVTL